jgi:hypothetical protein
MGVRIFGAAIMGIAYGIEFHESGDWYISLAEEVMNTASVISIPGAFLVDLFPILAYVPRWFRVRVQVPKRKLHFGENLAPLSPKHLSTVCKSNW